jgi:serine protease Do
VIRLERERDLALLETGALGSARPAEIGDSDSLRAGQLVVALGNPLGMPGAVAAGVIHAAARGGRWIQADLRLAPGNSGGMLADAAGRVVGITTMIADGLALAVPSNEVATFVRQAHLKRTA